MNKYKFYNAPEIIILMVSTVFATVLGVLFAFVYGGLVDIAYSMTVDNIWKVSLMVVGYITVMIVAEYLYILCQKRYLCKCSKRLRRDLFEAIMNQTIDSFEKKSPAEYIDILTTKVALYEERYVQKLIEIPCVVLSFVITVGASIWLDPLLMVGMLISAIIMAWAMSKTSKNIKSTMKEYSDSTQQYSKVTNEYMEGFRLLFSSDLISYAMKVHREVNEKREQMNYNKDKTQYKAIYSAQYIGLISTIVMMLLAIYFVAIGRISAGMVIAVSQLAGKMVSPFQSLSEIKVAMTSGRVIEKELKQILMLPKGENGNIEKSEFRDAIVLNNLSYCYPEGTEDTLSNISYKFEKGKKYAIVGPSGSGKTTLMSLLLGFHSDYKGEVLVDNVELKEIDKRILYKTIGTVPTDIFIFDTSLQENIALFQDVSEKKMHQALKDSCLLEGDNSLGKDNLNLSYKGNNVSSGERKRIGLARLLYHEYDVCLLDEFAANLDVDTAEKIENNILARKDNMIISVTHKLGKHLEKYDEIIVMQNGIIVEHGTYEALLDKKGVLYSMEKVG